MKSTSLTMLEGRSASVWGERGICARQKADLSTEGKGTGCELV